MADLHDNLPPGFVALACIAPVMLFLLMVYLTVYELLGGR